MKEPGRWHGGDPSHREVEHPSWRQIFYMETKTDKVLLAAPRNAVKISVRSNLNKHFILSLHLKLWHTATVMCRWIFLPHRPASR